MEYYIEAVFEVLGLLLSLITPKASLPTFNFLCCASYLSKSMRKNGLKSCIFLVSWLGSI